MRSERPECTGELCSRKVLENEALAVDDYRVVSSGASREDAVKEMVR